MTVNSWWNISYPVRRKLKITPKAGTVIGESHPIYVSYENDDLITFNKVREDFQDLEVVHYNGSNSEDLWTRLSREVVFDSEENTISVVFNAVEQISLENENYYIYMSNNNLHDFSQRPQYESSAYIITATPDNNLGFMFSRPTEHWDNGVSEITNAKATLVFEGINVKMKVEKGPDRGILEVKLDNEAAQYVDTYSSIESEEFVYEKNNLDRQKHYLRLRLTGNKSPSSTGTKVSIISASYSKYTEAIDQGEEFYSLTGSTSLLVGL